jgi:hypothetical protein
LAVKLRESCDALNRQQILNTSFPMVLIEEIIEELSDRSHPYRKIPIIDVYFHIYLALSDGTDPAKYEAMVDALEENRFFFSPEEARAMYKYAQNYCLRKINLGAQNYQDRLFQLYQQLLQNQLILLNGKLAHTDYKNIVTLGLKLKAFDWVKAFIQEYQSILMEPNAQNAYSYGLAAYHSETGNDGEAIKLLNKIDYTDIFYQISARLLLVHIYYERGDTDSLLYQISSFKQYLKRNQEIESERRKSHLEFLRFARKVARLNEKCSSTDPEKIKTSVQLLIAQINEAPPMVQKSWLEEKLREMVAN